MLRILIRDTPLSAGETAAEALGAALRRRPTPTLGVATGSSPLGTYEALAIGIGTDRIDLSAVRAFALDEYIGIAEDHPERYANVIDREVTKRINLSPDNVFVPDGAASDPTLAANLFEQAIDDAGGIDAQILGIGNNGHIGFNEPGSSPHSRTRVVALTPDTRAANARFFNDIAQVPTHAITQGIGTIMNARAITVIAHGEAKAEAVHHVVEGRVTTRWPGSVLQTHPDVTLVVDESAASRLEFVDQYRVRADLFA